MRIGTLLNFGAALALGAVAVIAVHGLGGRGAESAAPAAAPVTRIVVARTLVPFGTRLGREQLDLVTWPPDSLPPGAFTSIEQILDDKGDRVALRTIDQNEPVLPGKISAPGGRATLSTIVGHDMRALTIRVNDVLGVGGFVLPGDRVDVLLTRSGDQNEAGTDVLLQNIRVLGVDQEASDKKDKPVVAHAVTLELSPDDGQKLTLAASVGTLSLALRNNGDGNRAPPRTIRLQDLRGEPPHPVMTHRQPHVVAAAVPPVAEEIAILRGTHREMVTLGNGIASFRPAPAPPP